MQVDFYNLENPQEIEEIRGELLSKRSIGEVIFEVKNLSLDNNLNNSGDTNTIINTFVSQQGCSSLGDRWQEIDQEAAKKILAFIMTKDLAYSVELMSSQEAEQISDKVFNYFKNDCKLFTNATFVNNYTAMSAWDSLTKATFDTGVVMLNHTQICILWVKDED